MCAAHVFICYLTGIYRASLKWGIICEDEYQEHATHMIHHCFVLIYIIQLELYIIQLEFDSARLVSKNFHALQ